MSIEKDRMHILNKIDTGEIDVDEGMRELKMLGSSPKPADLTPLEILEKVENGSLSVEEATTLFGDGNNHNITDSSGVETISINDSQPRPDDFDPKHWKLWWIIPLAVGVFVTIISGWWMFSAWQNSDIGFWFFCSWIPFLLGLGVLILAWASRSAPWLHIRVKQKPGTKPRKISLSFPIPTGIGAWFIRTFGRYIPFLDDTGLDELIMALEGTVDSNHPLFVSVNEGEDGEEVQVYIG